MNTTRRFITISKGAEHKKIKTIKQAFKGSIEEIHMPSDKTLIPGHPANILKRENFAIDKIINKDIKPYISDLSEKNNLSQLRGGINKLSNIECHYSKKENLLFPYMEKHGITAPPKVMWGVDDEIRGEIKYITKSLKDFSSQDKGKLNSG